MNNESKGLLNKVKPSMDMVLTGLATSTIIGGIIFSNIELSILGMSVLIWVQLDKLNRKLSEQKWDCQKRLHDLISQERKDTIRETKWENTLAKWA